MMKIFCGRFVQSNLQCASCRSAVDRGSFEISVHGLFCAMQRLWFKNAAKSTAFLGRTFTAGPRRSSVAIFVRVFLMIVFDSNLLFMQLRVHPTTSD